MTQATHTQNVCIPQRSASRSVQLRNRLLKSKTHSKRKTGTENLAGFSTRYRTATNETRQRELLLAALVSRGQGYR